MMTAIDVTRCYAFFSARLQNDRQITHLSCVRLEHLLHDLFRGLMGLS